VRLFAPACVCSRISRRSEKGWLREEIPARLTELQQDPTKGIPAETAFFFAARGASSHEAGESQVGQWEYRIVFHPKGGKLNSNSFYDDIADRASPSVAWNFIAGIRNHCLGLSTFPQRGIERVEIMPGLSIIGYRRGRQRSVLRSRANRGLDLGYPFFRRPEHQGGIAGRPALKHLLRLARWPTFAKQGGRFTS